MPWIFFTLALICLAIAMKTMSIGVAFLMLLGCLGFLLAGALALVSSRIKARAQGAMRLQPAWERERLLRERAGMPADVPAAPSVPTPVMPKRDGNQVD